MEILYVPVEAACPKSKLNSSSSSLAGGGGGGGGMGRGDYLAYLVVQ